MAWLSDFTHHLLMPVANSEATGDRALDAISSPIAFLADLGECAADYSDVWVSTDPGEAYDSGGGVMRWRFDSAYALPCSVDVDGLVYVDATMSQGRDVYHLFCGSGTAGSPSAVSFHTAARETAGVVDAQTVVDDSNLIDSGFEGGTDGATLGAAWTAIGSPTNREYDTAQSKVGSKAAWLKGGSTNAYSGTYEAASAGMSADGSEYRVWLYLPDTTKRRRLYGNEASASIYGTLLMYLNDSGNICLAISDTAPPTGYTTSTSETGNQIGTYTAGWTQFRFVFDFTNDTLQISKRTSESDPWTQLKTSGAADYNIPMRGSGDVTQFGGMAFAVYGNASDASRAQMWVDEARYQSGGFTTSVTPESTSTAVQVYRVTREVAADGSYALRTYSHGIDMDLTHLSSADADTYYGEDASHRAGVRAVSGTESLLNTTAVQGPVHETVPEATESLVVSVYKRSGTTDTLLGSATFTNAETGNPTASKNISVAATSMLSTDTVKVVCDIGGNTTSAETAALTAAQLSAATWTVHAKYWQEFDPVAEGYAMTADDVHVEGIAWTQTDRLHALVRFFEGTLPMGDVSSCELYGYMTPHVSADGTLSCHRFGNASYDAGQTYAIGHIAAAWGLQGRDTAMAPTWNTRIINHQNPTPDGTAIPWKTPGATHADEIDAATASLALSTADTAGYRHFDLPAAWVEDWINTDHYSNGVLIKHSTDSGAQCYVDVERPVIVTTYASLAANYGDDAALSARKLSTDTMWVSGPYAGERCTAIPSEHGFGVHAWLSFDMLLNTAYFDTDGNVSLVDRRFHVKTETWDGTANRYYTAGPHGLHYDAVSHRFALLFGTSGHSGTDNPGTVLMWSDPGVPRGWSSAVPPTFAFAAKCGWLVKDSVAHITVPGKYFTYDLDTATWSSSVELFNAASVSVTERGLATAIPADHSWRDGSGTIELDGTIGDYPDSGWGQIDWELFHWTGKSGNTLTGVTSDVFQTEAAAHSIGATVKLISTIHQGGPALCTYVNGAYDATNDRLWITFSVDYTNFHKDEAGTHVSPSYGGIFSCYHPLSEAAGNWYAPDGTLLTLPLTLATQPRISGAEAGAWNHNLITLDDGTTIATYGQQPDVSTLDTQGGNTADSPVHRHGQVDAKYRRMDANGLIDIVDVGVLSPAVNLTDLGSGKIVFAAITADAADVEAKKLAVLRSEDSGATIGAPVTIADHSDITSGTVWSPSMAEDGNLNGHGMVVYHHENYGGALYMREVFYQVPPPTNVAAAIHTDHADVTWDDASVLNEGYYVERSVDGGAFQAEATITDGAATSYADTTIEAGHTYRYRVAAYIGTEVSAWVESNSVTYSVTSDLAIDDATVQPGSDEVAIVQTHLLTVAGSTVLPASDEVALEQTHILGIADATVQATSDAVTLTQAHDLAINDGTVACTSDEVMLTANLIIDDALVAVASETVALLQTHLLGIDDSEVACTSSEVYLGPAGPYTLDVVAGDSHATLTLDGDDESTLRLSVADTRLVMEVE